MIESVDHNGTKYPDFQINGNASRFCMPFALEVMPKSGVIYDIGYAKPEWKYPGAIGIDLVDGTEFHAMNLPPLQSDGIYSSHLLEHLERPYEALDVWYKNLKKDGIMFLYLPNMMTQLYHAPWQNRKHLHFVSPDIMRRYFSAKSDMWDNVFISERDAYDSFTVFCNKR